MGIKFQNILSAKCQNVTTFVMHDITLFGITFSFVMYFILITK